MLQRRLCEENVAETGGGKWDSTSTKHRLSRIVTKLSTRVIRAEENMPSPFFGDNFDTKVLILSLEELLSSIHEVEINHRGGQEMEPCSTMARSLVLSLCKAKKSQQGAHTVSDIVNAVGLDTENSFVGRLVLSVGEPNLSGKDESAGIKSTSLSDSVSMPVKYGNEGNSEKASAKLAKLLSDIAKADDRDESLSVLREFISLNPTVDVQSALEPLSPAFKAYILSQLNLNRPNINVQEKPNGMLLKINKGRRHPGAMKNVSERIRYLKSRLSATEAAVQSVIEDNPGSDGYDSFKHIPSLQTDQRSLPVAGGSQISSMPSTRAPETILSIRERLAAANNNKKSSSQRQSSEASSALGHAATLRARLEAVKNKKHESES